MDTYQWDYAYESLTKGTRDEVFLEPRSEFVARFTGVDNFFGGAVTSVVGGMAVFSAEKATFLVPDPGFVGRGYLLFRRRDLAVSREAPSPAAPNCFRGKVTDLAPTRSGLEVRVDAGIPLVAHVPRSQVDSLALELGCEVYAALRPGAGRVVRE